MVKTRKTVSVIMTVKNDCAGCAVTLNSLGSQTRLPDEIVVADGGSTNGTLETVRRFAASGPHVRLIEAPGANIARGRNLAANAARGDIIATIDAGCRAEPDWLEMLTRPFREDPDVEMVAGFYKVDACTLLEAVVGLATMRGQLEPVDPETFNPSARSMACTKALWARAGGWPEWVCFSEDTLFDHKVRRMRAGWRFAGEAVVHWRPRGSLWAIARQFYNYGTGRGHTQIGASDFMYHLRNLLLVFVAGGLCFMTEWAIPFLVLLLGYFYVWSFHDKSVRIARRTGGAIAYLLSIGVAWLVLMSHLAGYLAGSWQRWRNAGRYRHRMDTYLALTCE